MTRAKARATHWWWSTSWSPGRLDLELEATSAKIKKMLTLSSWWGRAKARPWTRPNVVRALPSHTHGIYTHSHTVLLFMITSDCSALAAARTSSVVVIPQSMQSSEYRQSVVSLRKNAPPHE